MDNFNLFQPTVQGRGSGAGYNSKALTSAPSPQAQRNLGGIGGFLVNNAPAIGGGLGAVAGLPLDIFGGAGSLAGGAAGSAIGEQIKQNILGTNRGNFGAQLGQDLIQGGETAALGGIGKTLGMARPAAKAALGIADAPAAKGAAQSGNFLQRMLNKQATANAQGAYNDRILQEFGNGGKLQANNGMQLNQVLGEMNGHKVQPGIVNMAHYGNAGFGYNDFLNNEIMPKGQHVQLDLNQVINDAVKSQPAASLPKGFQGKLASQLSDFLDPQHENPNSVFHPSDLMRASQDLYGLRTATGDAPLAGIYEKLRQNLINAAGKEGGLNQAIKETRLPSVEQLNTAGGESLPGAATTKHFLDVTRGPNGIANPTLAQEMVDNINKAESIQHIQRAEVKHVAANEIASSASEAVGKALPRQMDRFGQPRGYSLTGNGGISTAYELGMLGHGNLAASIPLAAKLGATSRGGRLIGKFGRVDESQVGPRVPPDLAALGQEAAPPVEASAPGPQVIPGRPGVPATPTKIGFNAGTEAQDIAVNGGPSTPSSFQLNGKGGKFGKSVPVNDRLAAEGTPSGALRLGTTTPGTPEIPATPPQAVGYEPPAPTSEPASATPAGTPGSLFQLQRPSGYRGDPGAIAAHMPTATAAAQALAPAAKGTVGGTLGFGSRMLAAPVGAPLKSGLQIGKQVLGRGIGNAMVPQALPAADAPSDATPPGTASTALQGILTGQDQSGQDSQYTEQAMLSDIARDPKNASTYMSVYKLVNPGSTKAPLTTSQTTSAMGIRDAAGSIQNYVSGIQELQKSGHAGYGTGAINSILGRMGIGSDNAKVYSLDSQKTDIATQLAKATTGGKPSAQAIKQWEESLPSVNDPASVVQDKLNSLAANLQTYYQSATSPIGAGADTSSQLIGATP